MAALFKLIAPHLPPIHLNSWVATLDPSGKHESPGGGIAPFLSLVILHFATSEPRFVKRAMHAANAEVVVDLPCKTGEGPLWHPAEQALYWLDIPNGRMFRFEPSSGKHEVVYEGAVVGGAVLQDDGTFLFFMEKGAIKIWRDGRLETVVDGIEAEAETRFNDAAADPVGRVFSGTMPDPQGNSRLYRIDPDRSLHLVLEGLGQSNGMDFTPDHKALIHADTKRGTVSRYPYDPQTGELSNPTVLSKIDGKPDGLVVDAVGGIWSARWGEGCLVRLDCDGAETDFIELPVPNVSSAIFGGEDLRDLYITTAGGDQRDQYGPLAGSLFRIRLEIPGHLPLFGRIA